MESFPSAESDLDMATVGACRRRAGKRRPRLFIREMVMRNFKSYAGEQRVGPFHKSFTAVVGPNGSGKSNVIDAMLFVFGKRAKQMRLNKVSELIHNSTNHQNLASAGVSVHFQEIIDLDDGTYKAIPGSDFVITRVAFRDNSSKYYINDRASNFTEVTKKLKGKGVDLDNNRFLILQGEVEQISLMKPKAQGPHDEGFLEYLEDIIGTSQYIGVVQMVKLAEKERDNLENIKNEAEAFMLKELALLKWQEKVTKLASDDAISHVSELQENVSILEEILKMRGHSCDKNRAARILKKLCQNSESLKDLEAVHHKYLEKQEELENDLKVCKDQFKDFERQDVKYREDLKHLKQKIIKADEKLQKDSSRVEEIQKECEESTDLIPRLQEEMPKLQQLLLDEESILEELRKTQKKLRSELVNVHKELEPWEKQLIEHKGKLDHDASRESLENAHNQMNEISCKIKSKNADRLRTQNELQINKVDASEAHKMEQELTKQQELLMPLEQAARQKVTELRSILESEKNQSSVLKAILEAKELKQIDGIYGRLGDLGAINAKYDVAISTACPGLDYIIVETTATAQACVELLRQKNLGIATFMILEKQRDNLRRLNEKVKTPEGVPRLFDLVNVESEKSKLAFFAVLGNTLVAKDLDQWDSEFRRVVTLDGALFEKSGTMSGTSIRASVSNEAVKAAEKELAELVEQLGSLRNRIGDAARQYQSAEKVSANLELSLAKCQKEIDSLNAQYNYIERQLGSLKAASLPGKDELERLEDLQKIIYAEENELERLAKCSTRLKEKASELQKKIENAGGEKLKNQKEKVSKIQSDIDKTSTEINRHKVKIVSNEKTLKRLRKSIEELKKDREMSIGAKEKLMTTFKEIEQKAYKVQVNYKKTQELIDKHKDVLDGAKTEYNKLKKTMDGLRAAEVDAEYKLQDVKKLSKDWEMKSKGYKKKLDELHISLSRHLEQLQKEAVDPMKLQSELSDLSNSSCDLKRALEMVALIEAQLKDMTPNLDSIAEYCFCYILELNAATQERDELKKQYDDLRKRRLDEFMAGFNTISLKLKEMYQMITLGGDAELELVDSLDPFSEGVVFSVRPPKKSWKNIANLSGGEKTLSSLALVFALHHYKPTPIYVMDEIDAALDFKNVSIVGHYVKDRTKDAQFIIISLRNNMFELADRLVGIYKTDNCTKSITIDPGVLYSAAKWPSKILTSCERSACARAPIKPTHFHV
ncbi:unnamed protein product [Spirodela intermedia]|uniref:Structural maintenance of chromosomes protein n=1 Tax=Spirodela intermedia TaxID=51605 RepID=A0A7I8JIH3_SPIIN|nr:unnamed protein product [Spirodela intermedia]CAA6669949.1 unnamed protein product [Spirodela intermedia]